MSSQQDDLVASALGNISICLPLMVAKPTHKEQHIVAWGWDFQFSMKHLTLIQATSFFLFPGLEILADWRSRVLLGWCVESLCCLIEHQPEPRDLALAFTHLPAASGSINRGDSFLMKYGP